MLTSLADDVRYAVPRPKKSNTFGGQVLGLYKDSKEYMEADLAASGLKPELLGAYAVDVPPDKCSAGYYIPYFAPDGSRVLRSGEDPIMYRYRMKDNPKGKKYTQPSKQRLVSWGLPSVVPYIHPKFHELAAKSKQIVICEGEKKAASVMHILGLPTIGIGGCWNWQCDKSKKLHPWIEDLIRQYGVEHVLIIPDGDIGRWDILKAYGPLGVDLRDRVRVDFDYLVLPDPEDKIDDLLVEWGPEAEGNFETLGKCKEEHLVEDLGRLIDLYGLSFEVKGQEGRREVHLNESNVAILMDKHPWFPEIWYNEDNDKPMYGDSMLDPTDSVEIMMYMQRHFQMPKLKEKTVKDALSALCVRQKYSPFLRVWQAEDWDGVDRSDWPARLWGLEGNEHCDMFCDHFMRWIVGLYARMVSPGCEMGFMLCLSGPQEIGKSGFGEVICDGLNVPMVGDHHGKDTKMLIHHGRVIVLDEMNALYAADAPYWKSMITNKKDPWRAPYASLMTDKPRGSVLLGTTNDSYFLYNDPTGQRRFAVIELPRVLLDFETLVEELPQIRAQARHLYESGWKDYERTSEEMRRYVMENHQAENMLEEIVLNHIQAQRTAREGAEPRSAFSAVEFSEVTGLSCRGKNSKDLTQLLTNVGLKRKNHSGRTRWVLTQEVIDKLEE